MLEKYNGIQILVAAVLIRQPFAILLAIVQVKHRGYRIYTKSIDMILFNIVFTDAADVILNLFVGRIQTGHIT